MSTPPTIHDSDRMAAEAMIAWLKEDHFQIDEKEFTEKLVELIARHHAEERAAVEALKQALEQIGTVAHCISLSGPATTKTLQDAWRKFDGISAMATKALTALRTASQQTPHEHH